MEGHYIRDAMETAVAEWFLVGEADFCMSPTFWTSTFTRWNISFVSSYFLSSFISLILIDSHHEILLTFEKVFDE